MDVYQTFLIDANRWGELKYTTIEQFEEEYFQVIKQGQNYGWYQTQFYIKARDLYIKFGDDFLKKFRDFLIEINPEKVGHLNDNELNSILIDSFGSQVAQELVWQSNN